MFLTKKGLQKVILCAVVYFILGSFCLTFALLFRFWGIESLFLFYLGVGSYVLGILFSRFGYYAETKGKLISLGNKSVLEKLTPSEFIYEYENIKNSVDLIKRKPDLNVLRLVALAYCSLGEKEKTLITIEEMFENISVKKKPLVMLIKSSYLFLYKETQKAEELFFEAQQQKLDWESKTFADLIIKDDRAMAMGDYNLAKNYYVTKLNQGFPKPNNLQKLLINYSLGEIYEKTGDNERAIACYEYCKNNGGETHIPHLAQNAINRLNNSEQRSV